MAQLPGYAAVPLLQTGRFSPEWYRYLKWLGERETSTEAQALPEYKLAGPLSIVVSGLLQNGLASLALRNDQLSPDPLHYYGTDESGTKGWHAFPESAVPYFIASGETYTVAEYKQALFSMPIDVEGTLAVDGYLIEVS